MNEMNAVGTIFKGRVAMYLYPDGTMIPIIAGGDVIDDWFSGGTTKTGAKPTPFITVDSWDDLAKVVGDWELKSINDILRDLTANKAMISDRFYKSLQGSLLISERAGLGPVAGLVDTPQIASFLKSLQKAGNTVASARDLVTTGGGGSSAEDRAFAAAEAEKDRQFRAQQAELDRREAERRARLQALQENLQFYSQIQPDNFRLGIGQNLLNNQATTPIQAYGNQLRQNIGQIQAGQMPATPAMPPIQGTGMAGGGKVDMTVPSPQITMGSTRRGILVGDREINGDEELMVFDVADPGKVEVIPIMGRAATGATVDLNATTGDPRSSYGILGNLYQPFGITSAGQVPTRSNASPTSLGYVAPIYNTDFAPVQPAAYGPLSTQYFDRFTGMLLPNPSTIMRELRVLRAQNPVAYAETLNAYEAATNQAGQPSGLPGEAIDAMLDASAIQGRTGNFAIGIR